MSDLSLRQEAISRGFLDLRSLAQASRVPTHIVYEANLGRVPKREHLVKIAAALRAAPRPGACSVEDVLRAIDAGALQARERALHG